jgi:serine/threonine-protein kinase
MGAEAANGIGHGSAQPCPRPGPFQLGRWRVDPALNRIACDVESAQLEPKVMDVLVRLAAEPGEVVSKQQLLDAVWNGDFVTESVLSRAIAELRSHLGDDARNPSYIATIAKRGYRLVANASPLSEASVEPVAESSPAPGPASRPRWRARLITASGAVAALAFGIAALGSGQLARRVSHLAPPHEPARLIVLPFDNYGPEDRANFALGVTDEITSQLAMVPRLHVISRTTAVNCGRRFESIRQVAEDLDVDFVLEGSVRWETLPDGSERIRITPQLIRADDDAHVWSASFDRSSSELLAVQSEIGRRVAQQLDLTLPAAASALAASGLDAAAYQAFLDGRAHLYSDEELDYRTAVASLERAVELEPAFVRAWALLSEAYGLLVHFGIDPSPERRARARAALDRATELDPNLPEVHRARGFYLYRCQSDLEGALDELRLANKALPNDSEVMVGIAYIERRRGNWEESLASHRRALELDPWNPSFTWNMGSSLVYLRRYEEAEQTLRRAIAVAPGMRTPHFILATACLLHDGTTERARRVLDEMPGPHDERWAMMSWDLQVFDGNHRAALELVSSSGVDRWGDVPTSLSACLNEHALGRATAAEDSCSTAVRLLQEDLEDHPRDPFVRAMLAEAFALLGDRAGAAHQIQLAREIGLDDAVVAADLAVSLAYAEVLCGDLDGAVDLLEEALRSPARVSVPVLRNSADWAPLHGNPRFRSLLATLQDA